MMVAPSGEKATEEMPPLCARCFSAFSSRETAASRGAVSLGREGSGFRGISAHAPASHTLSVSSREPDTIILLSGEKATEYM